MDTFKKIEREWMTLADAAAELGVTKARVEQYVRKGQLDAERLFNLLLVRRAAVKAFVKRPAGRPKGE